VGPRPSSLEPSPTRVGMFSKKETTPDKAAAEAETPRAAPAGGTMDQTNGGGGMLGGFNPFRRTEESPPVAAAPAAAAPKVPRKNPALNIEIPYGSLAEAIAAGKRESTMREAVGDPVVPGGQHHATPKEVEENLKFAKLDSAAYWAQRSSEAEEHQKRIDAKRALVKRDPTAKRIEKYVDGLGDKLPGGAQTAQKVKPYAPYLAACFTCSYVFFKYLAIFFSLFYKAWEKMPKRLIKVIYGTLLCFFGGMFIATIAAAEAFFAGGWRKAYYSMLNIYDNARYVSYALEEDDYKDDDGDGVADVDQISGNELVQRKTVLAMVTIKRPEELQEAVGNVWTAYLAVLATLRFQFARITAFAHAIAATTQFFWLKLLGPPLAYTLPKDTQHWVPVIIDFIVHFVALIFAWKLYGVVISVVSALRGGTMASTSFIDFTNERRWTDINQEETYIDEAAAFTIAALGVYFQLSHFLSLPFPLNVILFPVSVFEIFLQWQVTFGANQVASK